MDLKPFGPSGNKKVLLRERKRHTARRVTSTPYVVLTGYPPHPDLARGGTLAWGVPDLGTPHQGTPCQGTPYQGTPPARVPPARVPPQVGPGRVPPQWLPHGILGNVAKHYGMEAPLLLLLVTHSRSGVDSTFGARSWLRL